jgi:glyoxylase-like metal-dependent hydrolase (beta-lactamase superfamily II)
MNPATDADVEFDGTTLRLGAVRVHRVADIDVISWPRQAMFRDLTAEALQEAARGLPHAAADATGNLRISFNSYVIEAPDFLCLIDAGVGNDKERPDRSAWHRRNGDFLLQLDRLGFGVEDFDIIINTHLHADHVGWNTRLAGDRWEPTFPNARYVVPAAELDHWRARDAADPSGHTLHGAYADSVKPILDAGRFAPVDVPAEVASGLSLEPAPGHTPGMGIVRLEAGGTEVLFLADVLHSPIQLATPDLTSNFCTDPALARETRRHLLERCVRLGALTATYHFPPPAFGHIARQGDGYALLPLGVNSATAPGPSSGVIRAS